MMEKKAFEIDTGRVEACLVAHTFDSVESTEVHQIIVDRGLGVRGDRHAGPRIADVREHRLKKFGLGKGEIANLRQFSAISVEELAAIASAMEIPEIPRGCLGENLIVSGIPKFTQLPPGTELFFERPDGEKSEAVLYICEENMPCEVVGKALEKKLSVAGLASRFPKAAIGKRGIVGLILASGKIKQGDKIIVMVPHQRIYDPAR